MDPLPHFKLLITLVHLHNPLRDWSPKKHRERLIRNTDRNRTARSDLISVSWKVSTTDWLTDWLTDSNLCIYTHCILEHGWLSTVQLKRKNYAPLLSFLHFSLSESAPTYCVAPSTYLFRNPTETSTTTRETAASYLATYHEKAALKGQWFMSVCWLAKMRRFICSVESI